MGGSLSVSSVQPLGSLLPAGSVVTISGTGFTNATAVQTDDLALSAVQFISPRQIDITLAASANLEFHRVTVKDGVASVVFFPVLHGTIALQNPTQAPVAVTIFGYGPDDPIGGPTTVTVQPGATFLQPVYPVNESTTFVLPAAPIRVITTGASGEMVAPANSNVQVFFGSTPAPLLCVSSTQIDTVVPYETTGPAIDRSVVQIYATGSGATQPPSTTGEITEYGTSAPSLPVSLAIGSEAATIT